MSRTKNLALIAALTAIALTIFMIEAQLPPIVPIPGVKLGLSNIVTLVAMTVLGRREAGAVLTVRIFMGSVFAGSVSSLIFSAAGGLLAYLVMCLLIGLLPRSQMWVVSVLAALAHNAGQLAAAVFVSGTPAILIYAPALVAAGIITGAFTGIAASLLSKALEKTLQGGGK